ncbi:hypothetical protein [Mangrovicella endophytica]|uniref:hypothetical protein n=1 Tax=Mangrovicella endophytica TaxID=2066697 RepID=UPI001FE04B4E|nr:hypothetical protein [Mangrovicella endophytica]
MALTLPQGRLLPHRLADVSFGHVVAATLLLLGLLLGIGLATRQPPAETPYLKIAGAGFMFNYRIADAYYGFTVYVMKPVKTASVIEATFEDPGGGAPIVVREELSPRARQYGLRTPPLHGIRKDRPYQVRVRLLQWGDGAVLHDERFTVASQIDDAVMPKAPLTIGPGYMRNPAVLPDGSLREAPARPAEPQSTPG